MSENEYVTNGNMYGASKYYSNPLSNLHTKPFKTSVNKLYSFMVQRCLSRTEEYDKDAPLEFSLLRLMKREVHADNSLSIILCDSTYYFNDSKGLWRIDKYETLSNT